MKKSYIAGLIVVMAAGAAGYLLLASGDEQRIRTRHSELADLVTKDGPETVVHLAMLARQFGELFDVTCKLSTPVYGMSGDYGRAELGSMITQTRMQFASINLRFSDLTVVLDGENATVSLTIHVKAKSGTELVADEVREAKSFLSKIDGEWLFTEWQVVETLRK